MNDRSYEIEPDASDPNMLPGFLAGLLVGGLAGAGAMLLLAPQSGKRTRTAIQRKSMELREQAAGAAEAVEDAVTRTRARAGEMTDDVREGAADLQHRGQHEFDKQKERVTNAVEAGKTSLKRSRR